MNNLTDFLYTKAGSMRIPLSGTFELSPICNFSCKMCYVRKTLKEVKAHERLMMSLEDWREIAKEAKEAGMLYLLLTGGEPLLWPDFWTLYEELVDMGFLVSVNTNGSLIDETAIARFKKRPPHQINVTLYGANDKTYQQLCGMDGVFQKVDTGIKRLLEEGLIVKLNCSLTPENAPDLEWIVDYGKERSTVLSVATYMFPPVRRDLTQIGVNERFTPEDAAKYQLKYFLHRYGENAYEQYLKNILAGYVEPLGLEEGCFDPLDGKVRCRAGKASFWITWDGFMTPCGMMPEPKTDLKEQGFSKAWDKLVEKTAQIRTSGVCDECANRDVCHPCVAISYAETGQTTGIPVYMCEVMKHIKEIAQKHFSEKEKIVSGH